MAQIILLNDVSVNYILEYTRYIGPYVLATHLEKAGFDVVVIDKFTRHPDLLEYLESFIDEDTLFVGISSTLLGAGVNDMRNGRAVSGRAYRDSHLWLQSAGELREWTEKLKTVFRKKNSSAKLVLGGAKATWVYARQDPQAELENAYSNFDYIVLGLSDRSVVALAQALRDGKEIDVIRKNGLRFLYDLKLLEYTECPETVFSEKHAVSRGEGLPMEVARGCIYNCRFCYYEKKQSRRKPLETLRNELLRNYERFGTTVYHFCDDCFNDSQVKVEEVCGEILKLPFKIEWVSYARTDVAIRRPETLALMIESGARGLWFGIETLNAQAGKAAGKGLPPETIKKFLIDSYEKYSDRCLFQASFIIGLPHETVESQRETIRWLEQTPCLDLIDWGALTVGPYNADIDQTVLDIAEFSRNPQKYGFTRVEFPHWEHATMNSRQAMDLLRETSENFLRRKNYFMTSIWQYPSLRTLGYEWREIASMARRPELYGENERADLMSRRNRWMTEYWENLRTRNQITSNR